MVAPLLLGDLIQPAEDLPKPLAARHGWVGRTRPGRALDRDSLRLERARAERCHPCKTQRPMDPIFLMGPSALIDGRRLFPPPG